jgi:uncharacterized RDD family membrane protein YckC
MSIRSERGSPIGADAPVPRYCSTCGALLSASTVLCGECGARYRDSPYEKKPTDAPSAWAPPLRRRAPADAAREDAVEKGGEVRGGGRGAAAQSTAAASRAEGQYDRGMDALQTIGGWGHPVAEVCAAAPPILAVPGADPTTAAADGAAALAPPLDGCVPGRLSGRLGASIIDGLACGIIALPLWIGIGLLLARSSPTTAAVLCGAGVSLSLAGALIVVRLQGSRGVTLGTLIMGLRVVREDSGTPLGPARSLARWIALWTLPWMMSLSILLDPHRHGRGFQDRMIGGIVVDIRAGRDPLRLRPDDFERPDASLYLGEMAVPVAVREHLTAPPGAVWKSEETSAPIPDPARRQEPIVEVSPRASAVRAPVAGGRGPVLTEVVDPWSSSPGAASHPSGHPGDLEAAQPSASRRAAPARYRLVLDDGAVHELHGVAVLGRNPTAADGQERLVLPDETRTVSKSHLRLDAGAEGVLVIELGSTNGSALVLADGDRQPLDPHTPISLPDGASLAIGDRTLTVERMQ